MSRRFIAPSRKIGAGKPGKNNLSIILPAASCGKMKTIGCRSLINIHNQPLIQHQISTLSQTYPESEIITILGFDIDKIIQFVQPGTRVVENELWESRSVVSSIRLGVLNALNRNLLIVYGDLFFSAASVDNLTKDGSAVVYDVHNSLPKDTVGINVVNETAEHFAFGIPNKWAQILFIAEGDYSLFYKLVMDKNHSKLYLHELLNNMVDKGVKFRAIPSKSPIIEIDMQKDMGRL